uniref:Uncharacterized protein n=1 Tax=Opuntia streptacantha TaxID=393608 RepID=A0A7C9DI32_OPUST
MTKLIASHNRTTMWVLITEDITSSSPHNRRMRSIMEVVIAMIFVPIISMLVIVVRRGRLGLGIVRCSWRTALALIWVLMGKTPDFWLIRKLPQFCPSPCSSHCF